MKALVNWVIMCTLVASLLVTAIPQTNAQEGDPLGNLNEIPVLFPDAPEIGALDNETTAYRYLIMARDGDTIAVDITRTTGEIIPRLLLYDTNGTELFQRTAVVTADSAIIGTRLVFTIDETDWYYLIATSAPSVNTPNLSGTFRLMLTGTSYDIYEITGESRPPSEVENARILRGSTILTETFSAPSRFLANMAEGDTLTIDTLSRNTSVLVQNLDEDELLRRNTEITDFTSDADQWIILTIGATISDLLTVTIEWVNAEGNRVKPKPHTFATLPDIGQSEEVDEVVATGPLITCEVVTRDNVNTRNGPGTVYAIVGRLRYQRTATVIAQAKDEMNWTWWQLDDTTWVREDGVTEGEGCQNVAVITQEDTTAPPEGLPSCLLTALGNSNLRRGPSTDFEVGGSISYQGEIYAIGQYRSRGAQYTWWQTSDGLWIREDSVTEEGDCDLLPVTWQ